jgi:SAM-dependent methyltransferase
VRLNKIRTKIEKQFSVKIINFSEQVYDYDDFFNKSLVDESGKFLNIGSADFQYPGWTTTDMPSEHYSQRQGDNVAVPLDLTSESLYPFEDAQFDGILCTQVVEHLPYSAVKHMFSEAYRLLKPGGCFRVSCPNSRLYYEALIAGDHLFFATMIEYYARRERWRKNFRINPQAADIEQLFLNALFAPLSELQSSQHLSSFEVRELAMEGYQRMMETLEAKCSYDHNSPHFHISFWDKQRFQNLTNNSSFNKHDASAFNQSRLPLFRYVESRRIAYTHHNVYYECFK